MQEGQEKKSVNPPQKQSRQPGMEYKMHPRPEFMGAPHGLERLKDKVAIITGGDSGIGRAVAVAFAKEGADIAISYLDETRDAEETQQIVENMGQQCLLIPGDISGEKY